MKKDRESGPFCVYGGEMIGEKDSLRSFFAKQKSALSGISSRLCRVWNHGRAVYGIHAEHGMKKIV